LDRIGPLGPETGDAADLTVDPIVNLRDADLVELYRHRTSADRGDQVHALHQSTAHVAAMTPDDCRGSDSRL